MKFSRHISLRIELRLLPTSLNDPTPDWNSSLPIPLRHVVVYLARSNLCGISLVRSRISILFADSDISLLKTSIQPSENNQIIRHYRWTKIEARVGFRFVLYSICILYVIYGCILYLYLCIAYVIYDVHVLICIVHYMYMIWYIPFLYLYVCIVYVIWCFMFFINLTFNKCNFNLKVSYQRLRLKGMT